ncbi:MAG: TonB-dependent receptor [Pseudomonadota bacterium]
MKKLLHTVCWALLLPLSLAAQQPDAGSAAEADPLDALLADIPAEESPAVAEPAQTPPAEPAPAEAAAAEPPAPEPVETLPVQTLPEQAAEPPRPKNPRALEEIVVTAQKTEQSVAEVPVSVTALSGDFIRETGAADLADVSLYVPNVRVDADDPGSPQVFIRGFGTNAFNPSFESSVGFVQDEIFFGRPGYFTESLFDVAGLEVLRGPQNTLFGKNTIAGVFNVTSRRPGQAFEADGRYFYGEHGERRFEAGFGGMFADWGGARFSTLKRQQQGELFNTFLQRNEEAIKQDAYRLKLLLLPSDVVDIEMTAVVSDTNAPFWPYQLSQLDADTRSYLQGFDPEVEDDPYDFRTESDARGFINKGSETLGVKTQWDIGDVGGLQGVNAVLVLGGSKFHIDQLNELDVSPADIATLDNHEKHQQFTSELRFTGKADSLFGAGTGVQFVGGLYQFQSRYDLFVRILAGRDIVSYLSTPDAVQLATRQRFATGTGAISLPGLAGITAAASNGDFYQFDYGQDIRSLALFGQFTWNLTEKFSVTPGLRLNREVKDIDSKGASHCVAKDTVPLPDLDQPSPCILAQFLMSNDYDLHDLVRKEFDLSPKLALQYFADHGINYYTSYTKGAKSGGFNSISFTGTDLEYQSEKARTVEVGGKGQFLDGTLNASLTFYDTQFDNLQVLAFNGVFFDVSNAGSAISRGLEADFLWNTPYEPLRLIGSLGVLSAKYKSYKNAPAPISQGIGAVQDLDGRRIAFAPDRTATLTPTLSYPLGAVVLTAATDIIYQGSQFTDTDLDPATRVGGYFQYAARLIVSHPDDRWSLTLGGSNLADKRVLNQVIDATFFPGSYFAQQASGRQLFATLTARF